MCSIELVNRKVNAKFRILGENLAETDASVFDNEILKFAATSKLLCSMPVLFGMTDISFLLTKELYFLKFVCFCECQLYVSDSNQACDSCLERNFYSPSKCSA